MSMPSVWSQNWLLKYEVRTWKITFLLKMSTSYFFSDGLVSFSDDSTKPSDSLFPDYFDSWACYSGTKNDPSNGAHNRLYSAVVFYARIHSWRPHIIQEKLPHGNNTCDCCRIFGIRIIPTFVYKLKLYFLHCTISNSHKVLLHCNNLASSHSFTHSLSQLLWHGNCERQFGSYQVKADQVYYWFSMPGILIHNCMWSSWLPLCI
jgi:hypothetical protein